MSHKSTTVLAAILIVLVVANLTLTSVLVQQEATTMAWTTMRDIATDELVIETDMDALRGNTDYLLTPDFDTVSDPGVFNTSSSSWVEVTDANVTIETNGGHVLINVIAFAYNASGQAVVTVYIDGVAVSGLSAALGVTSSSSSQSVSFTYIADGLSAGSHTFTVYAGAVGGGTTYVEVKRLQAMEG